ncbi:MAG: HAMP domain-containing histidine kinase, partial [Thermoflexibacter sp.]|nr:HAMP domain-containing histidine kinase [Thermoflexibacter sp.]
LSKSPNLLILNTLDNSFTQRIDTIAKNIQNYNQAFTKMLEQYQTLGFKNYGLMGDLRLYSDSLHQLYVPLQALNLLKIQKLEQNYFISKDGSYADSLEIFAQNLAIQINKNPQLSDNERVKVLKILNQYLEIFKKIVSAEFLIGVSTEAGFKKKSQDFANASTKTMLDLIGEIKKEVIKNKLYLRNSFLAVIVGMVLLSIFLSYWQAGLVAKPIIQLSTDIRQVIENQFVSSPTLLQPIYQKDEVGQLTRDFQLMLSEIQRNLHQIQEKNLSLENHNQELNTINQQLAESENRLSKLNSVKDKMFSIISHDLRSPLNSMLGFFTVLEMQSDAFSPEETQQFSQETQKSVKRLLNLLDNLLQWSMSQTDEIEFKPEILNLNEIVAENLALYADAAERKKIRLNSQIIDNQLVRADENMLNFIIRNLLSNAIKFSNADSEIKIAVTSEPNYQLISIIDQGVGMSAEQASKIFDAQEHTSTIGTQAEKGTGLGLPLCKSFVECNGGQIWAMSEVGKGTTFSFRLPNGNGLS